jgi:hypothetical protein
LLRKSVVRPEHQPRGCRATEQSDKLSPFH